MKKEDITGLEINATQKQQLHKKLENSNYTIANTQLDTDVISAQTKMHEQELINDRIKLKRYLEDKRSKQPKKDTKRHLLTIITCTTFSSVLSVLGLIIDNNKNTYMLLATLALFVPVLAINAIVFQPIVIRQYQEFKTDITTISSLLVSLSIVIGSIASNYIFTSRLTDIPMINVVLASGFDLIPLIINLSVAKFEIKYYNETHENVSVRCLKTVSNPLHDLESKTVSIEGKQGISTVSTLADTENETVSTLVHTSTMKDIKNQEDLERVIDTLEDGTVLSPKLFGLQGSKNYYNWVRKCQNVKKVDNKYIKQKQKFTLIKKD